MDGLRRFSWALALTIWMLRQLSGIMVISCHMQSGVLIHALAPEPVLPNASPINRHMVRSTLLGVGSLRFERLQPMGQIWQNQDYNKRVFFWPCMPNISVILTSGVRIGEPPMPWNCMNLVLCQTTVPEVEKHLCTIAISGPGEKSWEFENLRNHSRAFTAHS